MLGDTARVVNIVVRAATVLRRTASILQLRKAPLIPQLHREADDRLCAFVQDRRDGGAIHATAHRHGDGVRRRRGV